MINLSRNLHDILKSLNNILIPRFIRNRSDAETFSIVNFIKFASKQVKSSDKVLDAGAGSCPYKRYFSHAKYESTDFGDIFDKSSKNKHNFICNLDKIPRPNNTYDVILNTQVLEHVEYPQKVINEFYRILKPQGKLFLTAPQGWGIHDEPYHFFNFTKYGLKLLFKNAGFDIVFIKPRGGIFWYLGFRIRTLPSYIYSQYQKWWLLPIYLFSLPICNYLIPLLFFHLDKLDKKRSYTLGYACYCKKK
ncbi:MAG: class I SAM-dependent methyltransferase [archaeon]|nr:class I SAM-dependent methyltransferase [archaeon]